MNSSEHHAQETDRIHSVTGPARSQHRQCPAQPQYIRLQTIYRGANSTSHHYQETHTSETNQSISPCNAPHCGPHRQANKKLWPNQYYITLQPSITTRCHMKEASHPSEPSEHICAYHHRYPITGGHQGSFHHRLY